MTEKITIPITTREKTIENLLFMRDGCSDAIPGKILHSFDENNRFKVRRGWFSGLNAHLENAIVSDILPDEVVDEIKEYFEWHETSFCNKKDKQRLTTKEDIAKANNILNVVLESLGVSSEP
jgi:hypothetical protein